MSEYERADQDITRMFQEKSHREGLTSHIGYFVTDAEAQSYEAWKSGGHRDIPLLILSGILLIATLAVSLAAVLA